MEELALHILDIAQNSVEAGAETIDVSFTVDEEWMKLEIADDGKGMAEELRSAATDPFTTTRTTRRVGMGLPFIAQASVAAGGGLAIDSRPGAGTAVRATFRTQHVDRAPVGDLEQTFLTLLTGNPTVRFRFSVADANRTWRLDTDDVYKELSGLSLTSPSGLRRLRELIMTDLGEMQLEPPFAGFEMGISARDLSRATAAHSAKRDSKEE